MKNFLLTCFILISGLNSALAVEIVYPKNNPVTVNAPSTFFIGSVKPEESLKINDEEITISPNGAFAQFVPLVEGSNEFVITTQNGASIDTLKFIINRPAKTAVTSLPSELVEYPETAYLKVKSENAPLRETPFDSGLNRLSHLPKGLALKINGEKGIFYRVQLNSTLNAWILKSDVEAALPTNPTVLKKAKVERKGGFYNIIFETDQTPLYTLKEVEKKLTLNLYNILNQSNSELPFDFKDNTITFEFSPEKPLVGYDVEISEDKLILKIREPLVLDKKNPLKNIIIVVDAGHGGAESGAIGGCGHREKDINLEISKKLETELRNNGAEVFMTRSGDNAVSLVDRIKFIKNKNAVISISIHANAIPDGVDPMKTQGTSVFYYHNQAKSLAQSLLTSMVTRLHTQDDKVRQASLALVRPTGAVSVLIEVGYIIHPEDYNMLLDPIFQQNCANAIVEGIKSYLTSF